MYSWQRQPDLIFVRRERLYILKKQVEGGPEVVVEILSPSNLRKAVIEKLADYARIGVRECWMLDLKRAGWKSGATRTDYSGPWLSFRPGQKVRSKEFPAFTLPASVFPSF